MKRNFVEVLLLVVLVLFGATGALAGGDRDITFVNKTDVKVYVAIYTDTVYPMTSGWYAVEPGKKRVIGGGPLDNTGYYAEATRNGKKVAWKGDFAKGWVNPKSSFKLDENGSVAVSTSESSGPKVKGITKVGFRKVNYKATGKKDKWGNQDHIATITLTIK